MEQTSALLKNGYTVSGMAFAVGYKDSFNFLIAFKNYFGSSPKKINSI